MLLLDYHNVLIQSLLTERFLGYEPRIQFLTSSEAAVNRIKFLFAEHRLFQSIR